MNRLAALTASLLLLTNASCNDGCRFKDLKVKQRHNDDDVAAKAKPDAADSEADREKTGRPKDRPSRADRKDITTEAPTVVFIVMDTVRADHLALCGYDRPTSPYLQQIAQRKGPVSFSCHAKSPGTWTVPSHTSYFTGVEVPVHENDSMGYPFKDDLPMLSEAMKAKGYQTLMVSANPTLSQKSGLWRGFDRVEVAPDLEAWRGPMLATKIRAAVRNMDPETPLFIFVNIIDAHDPYPQIPEGVGWVPPRDTLPFYVHVKDQDQRYHRYIRGEMTPEQDRAFLDAVVDGYDYGIAEADKSVERTIDTLRDEGWLQGKFRVVVTADHGEFLGEHRLLRHGCFTWEPVVSVPLVYYDPSRRIPLELPDPVSATEAYWLTLTGELSPEPLRVTSYSKLREKDVKGCADMAALWTEPRDKAVWKDGEFMGFDLATDPGEEHPLPLAEDDPRRPTIEGMAAAHAAHLVEQRGMERDKGRVKELEALGYVE